MEQLTLYLKISLTWLPPYYYYYFLFKLIIL